MSHFDRLRSELEKFYKYPRPEIELAELEKGLFKELGVERVKGGRKAGTGSIVKYRHRVLKQMNEPGYMVVHKKHRRTRDTIHRVMFREKIYKPLKFIIDQLEMEYQSGK